MLKHASAISQDMLVLFDLDRIQKGFSIHALLKEFDAHDKTGCGCSIVKSQ
jgi:hypothetical protein